MRGKLGNDSGNMVNFIRSKKYYDKIIIVLLSLRKLYVLIFLQLFTVFFHSFNLYRKMT